MTEAPRYTTRKLGYKNGRFCRHCPPPDQRPQKEVINGILAPLAIAAFALALTACTPKEKRVLSGAALGGVAGTVGGYLYDRSRKTEKRAEKWEERYHDRHYHR